MPIRVIIADDHPIVRDGLRMTIERSGKDIQVVGEAGDGIEVLKMAGRKPADVYVLDVTMPNMNGIEAARELLRKYPRSKIIMLSLHDTKEMVEEAMASGALGYLTKDMATRNIVEAITETHAGGIYLCPRIANLLLGLGGKRNRGKRGAIRADLTGQERRVLQLIAEGHSNKEIAGMLDLAANTVHAHRNNLMAKLNIHKQADLVRYAIREGIAKL